MECCCEVYKNNCYLNTPDISELLINHEKIRIYYAQRLLSLLEKKISPGPQTYGFEYEFISQTPLNLKIMEEIYGFLPETGFIRHEKSFIHESGMFIDFEPGGQIEFHPPPLHKDANLNIYLEIIRNVLSSIKQKIGIEYRAHGYMPGRKDSPLCLDTERYHNLHNRLTMSGTRGREMMKGTASIHFHAGIMDIDQLPGLFSLFIKMARMEEFKMGEDRRAIWDNTDSSRCGLPFEVNERATSFEVIEKIVNHAIRAEHIGLNKPFMETGDLSFDAFMYHLTTIFTDIRLNIKGPSIELRTTDSVPFDDFKWKWKRFIAILENNQVK